MASVTRLPLCDQDLNSSWAGGLSLLYGSLSAVSAPTLAPRCFPDAQALALRSRCCSPGTPPPRTCIKRTTTPCSSS